MGLDGGRSGQRQAIVSVSGPWLYVWLATNTGGVPFLAGVARAPLGDLWNII